MITDFIPFYGQHCETTATGNLLRHIGIELSEPMMFGLGQGLGFIYWAMKSMDFPFLGGRIKQDELTRNITKHMALKVDYKETASQARAWENARLAVDNGYPVGLKLDCYHLDYFTEKIHFAGHYVAMIGYDENYAYVVDAAHPDGIARTSLQSLAAARSEKGPMASKNLSYTMTVEHKDYNLASILPKAIQLNAADFLNPPIKNIGYKGIQKLSREIEKWFDISSDAERDFSLTASLMEGGGTGGALFRNLYRDFLKEAQEYITDDKITQACRLYEEAAKGWTEAAQLIQKAGLSKDKHDLAQASVLLGEIADREIQAMTLLSMVNK